MDEEEEVEIDAPNLVGKTIRSVTAYDTTLHLAVRKDGSIYISKVTVPKSKADEFTQK